MGDKIKNNNTDFKKESKGSKLKLLRVWFRISFLAAQSQLLTNWSGFLFIIGKIVRFIIYFVFLFSVLSGVKTLAGYNREQVIIFFLIFNLIDILTQFLFRGVYLFRFSVVTGNFDLDLLKPWPSFFRPIFGWTDILDLITLVMLVFYLTYFQITNHLQVGFGSIVLFIFMLINASLIAFAYHLLVCSICILTTEIDHLIWIYRDLSSMARFPTDIYPRLIQILLTFTIPVILIFTVPAKSLLGVFSLGQAIIVMVAGLVLVFTSLRFWNYSVRKYSSASS